ncbi:hypothetical protein ASE95_12285 [Sphingomonas sp. Leaf231]|uniref:hypothetical protein n=1 Tax=Sphingomonas sp. Leaf231 TaxID=1736301 RepID=UPI0006F637E5|nr:hypothetical protein [Sphingomonas sp. Leaf231]KQN91032.1 hypothetical protein ASE95_12285 [Sphingomonas sp. Leaf231]
MPLLPGQAREMRFHTRLWHRGIANGEADTRLVANGTFLRNDEIAPQIGMAKYRHSSAAAGLLRKTLASRAAIRDGMAVWARWTSGVLWVLDCAPL